ncbi:MAG: hypothetical protein ABI992_04605 [Chthoniobacterales bacterium]
MELGNANVRRRAPLPTGVKLLVGFFSFGAVMCLLAILALAFPHTFLDSVWRLKPRAQTDLQALGALAFVLMTMAGLACAFSAIGLARGANWGRRLAIGVLAFNLVGDTVTVLVQHDYRTSIGWPIGGAMIFYLVKFARGSARDG